MVLLFQCHFPFLYLLSLERYAIHNIEAFFSILTKLEIAKRKCDFFAIWTPSGNNLITWWYFSVSSRCVIWAFPLHFTSVKQIRNHPYYLYGMLFWSLIEKRTRKLVQSVLRWGFQRKRTRNYYRESHQKFIKVILLQSIILNIFTEKWG